MYILYECFCVFVPMCLCATQVTIHDHYCHLTDSFLSIVPACNSGDSIAGVNFDIMEALAQRGNFSNVYTVVARNIAFWTHPDGTPMSSNERIQEMGRDFDVALDTW